MGRFLSFSRALRQTSARSVAFRGVPVCFAAVLLFLLATGAWAQGALSYVITGNVTDQFTVTKVGVATPLKAETTFDSTMIAIRNDADGAPCNIQLGDGEAVLDIGSSSLLIQAYLGGNERQWGNVSLSGKIASSTVGDRGNPSPGVVQLFGNADRMPSVENNADITYTGNEEGSSYFALNPSVRVRGANFTNKGGALSTYIASNGGSVVFEGGTTPGIDNGNAASDASGGQYLLTVRGGTVGDATANMSAIVNRSGSVTISGEANIVSNNVSGIGGTIINSEAGGIVDISGGKVSNASGHAIYTSGNEATVTISGSAEVVSAGDVAISISGKSRVYLFGGTVSAATGGRAIVCEGVLGTTHTGGHLIMSGSPTVDGNIYLEGVYGMGSVGTPTAIEVLASVEYAFAPGNKKYTIAGQFTIENGVIVKNGAGFYSNFVIADDLSQRLAANVNDLIATNDATFSVTFDVNGAGVAPPATIRVLEGGTLGDLAMPSTGLYISPVTESCPNGCLNDGNWYDSPTQGVVGQLFDFGGAAIGTKITVNRTLILKWTNTPYVSTLSSTRNVPTAKPSETAVIAPITVSAGELTLGPNPVAKQSGMINFFWSGSAVKGGKLLVYDASGSLVKKIAIKASGTSTVASWDLTSAKGATVSVGTYAAKGVIKTKSGKTEKVSALFSVR